MAAEALIAESTRTLAVSWSIWDFMGLWTCAVGLPATIVCLAHKVATTVCPPPLRDVSAEYPSKCDGSDLDTTAGCHSAGAQIDGRAVNLYVPKCGRVLINDDGSIVLNVEATDGLPSVVYESVGQSGLVSLVSLRITIGED